MWNDTPASAELYRMPDEHVLEYCIPHLQRMFPTFCREWVLGSHVWRARYSQPIVGRHYSHLIPSTDTPIAGLFLSTMAQIYPEDRGTNYAIRDGRHVGMRVAAAMERLGRETLVATR